MPQQIGSPLPGNFILFALRVLTRLSVTLGKDSAEIKRVHMLIDQIGVDQDLLDLLLMQKCQFPAEIALIPNDPDSIHASTRFLLKALQNRDCESFCLYLKSLDFDHEEITERLRDFAKTLFSHGEVGIGLEPTREERLRAAQMLGSRSDPDLGLAAISRLVGLSRGAVYRAIRRARLQDQSNAVGHHVGV